ncbi:carbon-nitrogen hydrolase family protein [Xanthomonas sacchari]|uniref:carbon-nitrogen hydrolase family protein n=1 Tax=Xanthomonas sacchari TaxID=56458 RepID=UPI0020C401AD|nr:carbon-nitrogen hydrolase family protein [Xanthomonas sacchari]
MRIAAIQCAAIDDDLDGACQVIVQRLHWAAAQAIDLLVFPEAFLLGHSYDAQTIRRRARQASEAALDVLCRHVAGFETTLVIGAFELRPPHVFNSALVVEHGRITGRYAKAHPNEPVVSAGRDFPTFLRSGLRYGINVCNDANHADAAARIAAQGAALIVYPLNNMLPPQTAARWRARSLQNLVDRARQTHCWIASADVTGMANGHVSYGCTAIVAPDGRIVARVPESSEGAAVYDVPKPPPAATRG